MNTQRLICYDLIKLFAIILVVLGHIIVFYHSEGYNSPVAVWIYSFHIPMFMFVSGVFFCRTLKKSFKDMLRQKSAQLLIPLCTWSIVDLICNHLIFDLDQWKFIIRDYLFSGGPLHGLWYLKCLFIYLVVCFIAIKVLRNVYLASIITVFFFIILPNINFINNLILFFWSGYYYNCLIQKYPQILSLKFVMIMGGLALICCMLFHQGQYLYISNHTVTTYFIYYLNGISSTLFWVSLFYVMTSQKSGGGLIKLSKIGASSLGIYCMHEYFYMKNYWGWLINLFPDNYLFYLLWALLITYICYFSSKILCRNRVLALLFMGILSKNK